MKRIASAVGLLLAVASIGDANVWMVPRRFPSIQMAIDYDSVMDGDEIWVWGPLPGQPNPPYVYRENLDFKGKSLRLVNLSFIPDSTPGYDSSCGSVVIDGGGSGPVITLKSDISVPSVTIKGFTIDSGSAYNGGGIYCAGVRATIAKDRIVHCAAETSGGGIFASVGPSNGVMITGCEVDSNTARSGFGGGIAIRTDLGDDGCVHIYNDTIVGDSAKLGGGGVALIDLRAGKPGDETDTVLLGDDIEGNAATTSTSGEPWGGGVYVSRHTGCGFRNVIVHNRHGGVYERRDSTQDITFIWGVRDENGVSSRPGFNVFMANGERDVILEGGNANGVGPWCLAGNYWGSLDSTTIYNHIICHYARYPDLPFIAASGRLFEVDSTSTCTFGVIVTGDLRDSQGVTLHMGEYHGHRTYILFADTPDYVISGEPATKCDLSIAGTFIAQPSAEAKTLIFGAYHGLPPNDSLPAGNPDDWYGIHVLPGGSASLERCVVADAYLGIDAEGKQDSVANVHLDSDTFVENQLGGVLADHANLVVTNSAISGCGGAYGIRCQNTDWPETLMIHGTSVTGSQTQGVSVEDYGSGHWSRITRDSIDGGPTAAIEYGVNLWSVPCSLIVESCDVRRCYQIAANEQNSSARLENDRFVGTGSADETDIHYYGIMCNSGRTSPKRTRQSRPLRAIRAMRSDAPHVDR